jgi:hypothetical protein
LEPRSIIEITGTLTTSDNVVYPLHSVQALKIRLRQGIVEVQLSDPAFVGSVVQIRVETAPAEVAAGT